MKKVILPIFLLSTFWVTAQNKTIDFDKDIKPLNEKVKSLQRQNSKLTKTVNSLSNEITANKRSLDSLKMQTEKDSESLVSRISSTEKNTDQRISNVAKSLGDNSLYGIIGVLSAILLSGLLYWLLSRRQQTDKNQLSNISNSTKTELTQESAKLDLQLLDVIEKQLKVADKLNETEPTIDHAFHKNSANELQRIANYANTLAPESQEAIALQGSLGRLRNYFNASDYEITDFAGNDYDERIPMIRKDTIFDESLPIDKEIISKALKPQIKFKGDVIQEAEVITKYNN
jgi:hypothetical protein